MSRTSAQTTERACSCSLAGRCSTWASVGRIIAATASMRSVAIIRGVWPPKRSTPCLQPPARKARPRTRSAFERIEPIERGLDDGDEPGLEREDADEELGQVADRRLDDAGRGRARGGCRAGRSIRRSGRRCRRAPRPQTAKVASAVAPAKCSTPASADRRAGGGRHHQVAACDRCRHWRCPSRPSPASRGRECNRSLPGRPARGGAPGMAAGGEAGGQQVAAGRRVPVEHLAGAEDARAGRGASGRRRGRRARRRPRSRSPRRAGADPSSGSGSAFSAAAVAAGSRERRRGELAQERDLDRAEAERLAQVVGERGAAARPGEAGGERRLRCGPGRGRA